MYYQPSTLDDLIRGLKRLNEADCKSAIKILRMRLKDLHNTDFYFKISLADLDLSTRAHLVLKNNKLETVWDILECGWDNIGRVRNAGPQTVNEIKNKVESIVAAKSRSRV